MGKPRYYRVLFDHAKSHVVPASLLRPLIRDLKERGHGLEPNPNPLIKKAVTDAKSFFFDQHGMCHIPRPLTSVMVKGLRVEMPCEFVATLLLELERHASKSRQFAKGREYRKVHGCYWALVMTPSFYQLLIKRLKEIVVKAEQTAAAFYAGLKPTNVVLAEANFVATGKKLTPEQCGVDRQARFHRERGEA